VKLLLFSSHKNYTKYPNLIIDEEKLKVNTLLSQNDFQTVQQQNDANEVFAL